MTMPDLSRHAPPGIDLEPEKWVFGIGTVAALFYSFGFFSRYQTAVNALYRRVGGVGSSERVLIEGAVMPRFSSLLGDFWLGFAILAACMLGMIIYHYAYHRQGSRSIYLMKRLPNRWELHRRCLTIPVAAALICALSVLLLTAVYFAVYMLATPSQCLPAIRF